MSHLAMTGGRILIVDDDRMTRVLYSRSLSRLGYAVACASSGVEALEFLDAQTFDIVLLDIVMPKMSGIQTLETINALPLRHRPRIFMLSAAENAKTRDRCLELGARRVLQKPVTADVLRAEMRNALAEQTCAVAG